MAPLLAYPSETYLRRARTFFLGDFADGVDEFEVLLEVFGLEAWEPAAEIVFR